MDLGEPEKRSNKKKGVQKRGGRASTKAPDTAAARKEEKRERAKSAPRKSWLCFSASFAKTKEKKKKGLCSGTILQVRPHQ
jgi:hypothetical protein